MKTKNIPPTRGFDLKLFNEVNKKRSTDGLTWKGLLTKLFKIYLGALVLLVATTSQAGIFGKGKFSRAMQAGFGTLATNFNNIAQSPGGTITPPVINTPPPNMVQCYSYRNGNQTSTQCY